MLPHLHVSDRVIKHHTPEFIQSNDATVKQNNNTQSFISVMSDKGVSTPMY